MKEDKDLKNNLSLVQDRISYYYKEVFNIEILGLLYKNEICRTKKEKEEYNNYLNLVRASIFNFFVLIKDNNKKFFKYKLIKGTYDNAEYRRCEEKRASFIEKLYYFVDKTLCVYCKKRYLEKCNKETVDNIIEKDNKINSNYHKLILEKNRQK